MPDLNCKLQIIYSGHCRILTARSGIFRSQNDQNTAVSEHFWKLRCRKSVRSCGGRHISKSKCEKHTMFGPFLHVHLNFHGNSNYYYDNYNYTTLNHNYNCNCNYTTTKTTRLQEPKTTTTATSTTTTTTLTLQLQLQLPLQLQLQLH